MTDGKLLLEAGRPNQTASSTRAVRSTVVDVLLWCLLCALLAVGFANARTVSTQHTPISLRFNTPVSGQAAYAARTHSIEHNSEPSFWPTFWHQGTASLTTQYATVNADCISYSGEASLVWPTVYMRGTAPGIVDGVGCAVSTTLAWRLWGNTDAVGKPVEVDGAERVVRGVFDDTRELILLSFEDGDTVQRWSAVELSGGSVDAIRGDTQAYAAASGLGKPDSILMGGGVSLVAEMVAMLPLLILAGYAMTMIIGLLRQKRLTVVHNLALFLLVVGCIALLPRMLDALPAWTIPIRWSDFSFWTSLVEQAYDSTQEFLGATSTLRDVEGKIMLFKQAGLGLAATCCAICVCFRWHMRR